MEIDFWSPLPVPGQIPQLIRPTIYGGAADRDSFWIEGEDLWDFWQHPITGEVRIEIPSKKVQGPISIR